MTGEPGQRSRRLAGMGEWMKRHSRSIYGCTQAPSELGAAPQDCRYTYNPKTNRLYVHLFAWPFKHLHLPSLADHVRYARLMSDSSELVPVHVDPERVAQNTLMGGLPEGTLTLQVPLERPETPVPVIELFLTAPASRTAPPAPETVRPPDP